MEKRVAENNPSEIILVRIARSLGQKRITVPEKTALNPVKSVCFMDAGLIHQPAITKAREKIKKLIPAF